MVIKSIRGTVLISKGLVTTNGKICYAPDGKTTASSYDYQPCIPIVGIDSMCCALNRTIPGADSCTPNGLCNNNGQYYRDFCTDPTWESPNCLSNTICADGEDAKGTPKTTQCPQDGTWCCGQNNLTCCTDGKGFKLEPTLVQIGVNTTSNTTEATATSTKIKYVDKKGPNFTTVGVGVGVGVSLGFIAVVGTLAGFWFGQKRGIKRAMASGGAGAAAEMPLWRRKKDTNYQAVVAEPVPYGGARGAHEVSAISPTVVAELGNSGRR
ncbi:hypothetical protein BJ875DRAFT_527337 [Amylocarpus encephaloides]|uniref:Mid2 domain-containing protein n=1 Tax=Amylocarpus encephaloides TaxID=45428 RepID=A0A9P7YLQ8_9HELO|nr:hypothetical protein BJ875DRAFT_527337 [Amylocarpus encephaloides]